MNQRKLIIDNRSKNTVIINFVVQPILNYNFLLQKSPHLAKMTSSICVGEVIEYIVWGAIKGANKIKRDWMVNYTEVMRLCPSSLLNVFWGCGCKIEFGPFSYSFPRNLTAKPSWIGLSRGLLRFIFFFLFFFWVTLVQGVSTASTQSIVSS